MVYFEKKKNCTLVWKLLEILWIHFFIKENFGVAIREKFTIHREEKQCHKLLFLVLKYGYKGKKFDALKANNRMTD